MVFFDRAMRDVALNQTADEVAQKQTCGGKLGKSDVQSEK